MGHCLVLVDRDKAGLERIAAETKSEALVCDLVEPDAAERIAAFANSRGVVTWLINNAGLGYRGAFGSVPIEAQVETVMVNALAPMALVQQFLPEMLKRGRGVIVNLGSPASFQSTPYLSVYGASKAFLLSFTEALWAECLGHGVRVLCLCPSGTNTAFQDQAGVRRRNDGKGLLTPEEVVDAALRALGGNACTAVVGRSRRIMLYWKQFLPRTLQVRFAGWIMRRFR